MPDAAAQTTPAPAAGYDANAVRARIAAAITACGTNLTSAAQAAGFEHSSLSRFLNAKTETLDIRLLTLLAPVLGTTVGALLGEQPTAEPGRDGGAGVGNTTDPDTGDANDTAESGTMMLRLDQLVRSQLNPRKTFDEDDLAGLRESVAVDGILQNLVVRPHLDPATGTQSTVAVDGGPELPVFEIIGGERRWRVLNDLSRDGRWDPAASNIRCVAVNADNAQALVLAIVENLQRQDVPPIEEADAFAALQDLDPATWSSAAIAERIGKTPRYVQQRIALSEKLAPACREALQDGTIDVTRARILCTVGSERQAELLELIRKNDYRVNTERGLRENATYSMVPAERAIFDVAASGLETVTNDQGETFIPDRDGFEAAQRAAVEARVLELGKQYPWVEFLTGHTMWSSWPKAKKDTDPAEIGAVVLLDHTLDVEIREGVVRAGGTPLTEEERAARIAEQDRVKKLREDTAHAIREIEVGLSAKIADDPAAAMRLAVLSFLARDESTSPSDIYSESLVCDHGARFAHLFGALLSQDEEGEAKHMWMTEDATTEGVWDCISGLDETTLSQLFAALVADSIDQPKIAYGGAPTPGLNPVTRALAQGYGIAIPEILTSRPGDTA